MKKKQLNYYVGLKAAMVHRAIVAVIFFAILMNIVNLGAFYKGSIADLNSGVVQSEIGLIKIFNSINLPMKIVEGLFKSDNLKSEKRSEQSIVNDNYVVLIKPFQRSGTEILKKGAYFPISGAKNLWTVPVIDTGPVLSYLNLLCSKNFIMILMLVLLLMSVLPRGISINNKKIIYKNTRPVFI